MSRTRCYLGLDLGTSSLKVGLFSPDGRRLALASEDVSTYHPQPDWAEQRPGEWWAAARAATREVLAESGVKAERVAAVGLSSHTPAAVLLDARDEVVAPALIWADLRAVGQWRRLAGEYRIPHAYNLPSRLLWLREHQPKALEPAAKLLMPKDFLGYRLTGVHTTDVTDAEMTRLREGGTGPPREGLLGLLGLDADLLPPVTGSTAVKGGVTPRAADETGLAPGTPVVAGAVDAQCNMVGAGLVSAGQGVLYLGTGAGIRVVLGRGGLVGPTGGRAVPMGYGDGLWWYGSMMGVGGAALKWFRDSMRDGGTTGGGSYETYDRWAAGVPAGADGLLFIPHLHGERSPYYDHRLRGALVGLRLYHGAAHVVRAMMEGVAFNVRAIADEVVDVTGAPLPPLRAVGGGAQSATWRQVCAAVLGTPLELMAEPESTVLGAALLGAVGVGDFPDVVDACHAAVHVTGRHAVDPELVGAYARLYRRFKQAGDVVRKLAVEWAEEDEG